MLNARLPIVFVMAGVRNDGFYEVCLFGNEFLLKLCFIHPISIHCETEFRNTIDPQSNCHSGESLRSDAFGTGIHGRGPAESSGYDALF
jgi:hypothetical protein